MHGKEPEVLDGTQLAADFTFSGLQKFGQGLEERLRGLKYPSKILEKVCTNIQLHTYLKNKVLLNYNGTSDVGKISGNM